MSNSDFLPIRPVQVAAEVFGTADEGGMALDFPGFDGGSVAGEGPGGAEEQDD